MCVRGFCFVLDICSADVCELCVFLSMHLCRQYTHGDGRWLRSRFMVSESIIFHSTCSRMCIVKDFTLQPHWDRSRQHIARKIMNTYVDSCAVRSISFSVTLMHLQLIIAKHFMKFKCAMPNVSGSVRNAHTAHRLVGICSLPTVYCCRIMSINAPYAVASIRRLVHHDETICRFAFEKVVNVQLT